MAHRGHRYKYKNQPSEFYLKPSESYLKTSASCLSPSEFYVKTFRILCKALQNFVKSPSEFYVMPFRILCSAPQNFLNGKNLSESTAKEESTQNEKGQSSGGDAEVIEATSGRMSFAQLKALKEEDRTKHFTKKKWKKVEVRNQRATIIKSAKMENSNWNYDKQGRRSTG